MNEMIWTVALFFGLQLVNVILNTLKTLIMAKSDNKHASAIINAATFGFYTAVVQQIGKMDLMITIPVTMVTNVIGVYLTYLIMRKARKDDLWKIEIFTDNEINIICAELEYHKIAHTKFTDKVVTAYAYTQVESEKVDRIVKTYKAKYNITVITKKF